CAGAHPVLRSNVSCRASSVPSPLATQRQKPGRAGRRSYSDPDGICQCPTALPIRLSRASIGRDERPDAQMRPSLLNPLFAAVPTLPGAGPHLEKLYRRLFGREQPARVIDLLFHLPTGAIDRRARPKLRDVVPDTVVTVAVTVDRHRPPPPHRPRVPYQVYTS